jgi:hypothetical protein
MTDYRKELEALAANGIMPDYAIKDMMDDGWYGVREFNEQVKQIARFALDRDKEAHRNGSLFVSEEELIKESQQAWEDSKR